MTHNAHFSSDQVRQPVALALILKIAISLAPQAPETQRVGVYRQSDVGTKASDPAVGDQSVSV